MADIESRIKELQQPMLKKRLYVVFAEPLKPAEDMFPVLPDHLDYMIGLEKRGVLFASGPFLSEDGSPPVRGMTILRAESREEALSIAKGDPFFKVGLREYRVEEWQVMEGSFSVRVNYSNGTYSIG